jgi:hypothetical protein
MRVHPLTAAAGLVLVAATMAACGGSSGGASLTGNSGDSGSSGGSAAAPPSSASSSSVNVCALMSAKKATSISGTHYTKPVSSHDMCSYTPTDAPIGMYIILTTNAGSATAWQEQLATLQEDGGTKPVTLSGAGDRAAGCGTEIGVQAGNYIIDVHGGDPNGTGTDANPFPKSIAIAKAIASELH